MPGETASTEGGRLSLGVLARQFSYVMGATPKLTDDERLHILEGDFLPSKVLGGAGYDLVFYRQLDFLGDVADPDQAFADFAKKLSPGLGERALSEHVKYIDIAPKTPHTM